MSTSRWSATIEDKNKAVLAYCTTISGATLSLPLNNAAEFDCSFSSDGQDTTALITAIASKTPFIRLAENGTTRFWGPLASLEVSGGDALNVQAKFTDPVGAYANISTYYLATNRRNPANSSVKSVALDTQLYTVIIDRLLNLGSPLVRLTRSGSISSSTRSFVSEGADVLDSLVNLANLYNSFDFYVTPDSTLTVGYTLGTNKSNTVAFRSGGSGNQNIASFTSQLQPPRNNMFGTDDTQFVKNLRGASAGITAFGEYAYVARRANYYGMTVDDVNNSFLRESWRNVVSLDLEPAVCPRPWTDFYLGDTVSVLINPNGSAFSYTGSQRVTDIGIQFDDQMEESTISVGFESL